MSKKSDHQLFLPFTDKEGRMLQTALELLKISKEIVDYEISEEDIENLKLKVFLLTKKT